MASDEKQSWLDKIKSYANFHFLTVPADKKVLAQLKDQSAWKIDFIVVQDGGKVVSGVIDRQNLSDIMTEKRLEQKNSEVMPSGSGAPGGPGAPTPGISLEDLSFRDLLEDRDFKEYYILDQNAGESESNIWMQGLPPREVVIVKGDQVQAVIDRRGFRKWQALMRPFRKYFGG